MIEIAAVNGPERADLARTCHPYVEATVTKAARTTGEYNGTAKDAIATAASGNAW